MTDVCIIGAGWAGLAAAVKLCQQNIAVTVYESAKQIGGRARTVEFNHIAVDNGQHLMIGAYQETLNLLKIVGLDENEVLYRYPQKLQLFNLTTGKKSFELSLPKMPAPLHLLVGMLRCPSMNMQERFSALFRFNNLLNKTLQEDISVNDWLLQAKLPTPLTENLLLPLCLAAMTTHPQQTSAKSFQAVLQKTFSGSARHTDFLIPNVNLSNVFPIAAKKYIESHGGKVITSARCQELVFTDGHLNAVKINHTINNHKQFILATPANITAKLCQAHAQSLPIAEPLQQLNYETIITIYLQYPHHIALDLPMIGLLNGTAQWLFDRRICGQKGLMAAVISASGEHDNWDDAILADKVSEELAQLFPTWPKAEKIQVIREKRAAFACHVNVDKIRPFTQTSIKNLSLCGDYVLFDNKNSIGLPSTLEAATHSGVKCAQLLSGSP